MYPYQSQFSAGFNSSIMHYGAFPDMQFSYPHAHHNGGLPGPQVHQQGKILAQPVSTKSKEINYIDYLPSSSNIKRFAKVFGHLCLGVGVELVTLGIVEYDMP